MLDGIVTKPFNAHLVLEDVERRLEVGERVAAEELAQWGRSVDHLVNTGKLALVNEVVAGEASIDSLVQAVVLKADELNEKAIGKLQSVLPKAEADEEALFAEIAAHTGDFVTALADRGINLLERSSDEDLLAEVGRRGLNSPVAVEAEGDGASGADGDPGGVGADAPASPLSASDPAPSEDPAPAGTSVANAETVEGAPDDATEPEQPTA